MQLYILYIKKNSFHKLTSNYRPNGKEQHPEEVFFSDFNGTAVVAVIFNKSLSLYFAANNKLTLVPLTFNPSPTVATFPLRVRLSLTFD
jgi:hypothetical protein